MPPLVGDRTDNRPLLLLIAAATIVRLGFALATGLGVDESYMVAAGRTLSLGYFDHPPAAWWLSWSAARLAGSEAPIVVRLPFIALFAVATWLMHRLTARLYGPRAGLWAAVTFNLAPVFGITTATWVLPDGPLDAALLGAALCLVHALQAERRRAASAWWIAAGLLAGLALFSKYSAILTLGGVGIFLLSTPAHRPWLLRPAPYLALLASLLVFSPVLLWNAGHGWASFAFQAARADATVFRPLMPLTLLGGEALYLLPWIWVPLMLCFVGALARGPRDWPGWLLACLAAPPIVGFALVALWSRQRVLPHWAAPGYLMLFPLLGAAVAARLAAGSRATRRWLAGTAAFVLAGVALAGSEIRYAWPIDLARFAAPGNDPTMEATDWTALGDALRARSLLGPSRVVAATNWRDAGKIAHALDAAVPVTCLNPDARQFGLVLPAAGLVGRDLLIVVQEAERDHALATYAKLFDRIEPLPPVILTHAGRPALTLALLLGHGLRVWPPPAISGLPSTIAGPGRFPARLVSA